METKAQFEENRPQDSETHLDESRAPEPEALLKQFIEDRRRVEQKTRRRVLLLTFIPILFAVLFLGFMYWRVSEINKQLTGKAKQLDQTNASLVKSTRQLGEVNSDLQVVQEQLSSAQQEATRAAGKLQEQQASLAVAQGQLSTASADLQAAAAEFAQVKATQADLEEQVKHLLAFPVYHCFDDKYCDMYFKNLIDRPGITVLGNNFIRTFSEEIFQARGAKWNVSGSPPEQGFNSPSFAAYMLYQAGALENTGTPILDQAQLMNAVPPVKGRSPQPGDIIYYKGGYSLFYFKDTNNKGFVIGMTPIGVITLVSDFGEIIGVGIPKYR